MHLVTPSGGRLPAPPESELSWLREPLKTGGTGGVVAARRWRGSRCSPEAAVHATGARDTPVTKAGVERKDEGKQHVQSRVRDRIKPRSHSPTVRAIYEPPESAGQMPLLARSGHFNLCPAFHSEMGVEGYRREMFISY